MKKNSCTPKFTKELCQSLSTLPKQEQKNIKGGALLYCEEKRRKILGVTVTTRQWKLVSDGSLTLTIKM